METVLSINPTEGPDLGNITVQITGNGFIQSDTISCRFGTIIVSAVWKSPTILDCSVPQNNAGTEVLVAVSNNGVDFSSSSTAFVYQGTRQYSIRFDFF